MGDAILNLNETLSFKAKECLFDGEFWQKFNQDKKELYNIIYKQLKYSLNSQSQELITTLLDNCIVFKIYNDIARIRYYYGRYRDKLINLDLNDSISDYLMKMINILNKDDLLEYDSSFIVILEQLYNIEIITNCTNYKRFDLIIQKIVNKKL